MNFRLSNEAKTLLKNSHNKSISKKRVKYYDSQDFYKRCPDLAPSNIYLYLGRTTKLEDTQKYLDKITKETFIEKCSRWYKNIKNWFNKNKNL